MSRSIQTKKVELSETEKSLNKGTLGKLLFTLYKKKPCALLIREGRLIAARFFQNETNKVGGVYIGKVKNVAKNIGAYFVQIGDGEICFLPESSATMPCLINRDYDNRILEGDEILVQVTREAQKTKQATVSAMLSEGETLLEVAKHRTCFSCIKEPIHPFLQALEDLVKEDEYDEIITDQSSFLDILKQASTPVRFYQDSFGLSQLYSLETKMGSATDTKVWLKSGAYLIIEPTEAMTVIDVNTGKNEVKKASEELIFQVNLEAAREIALQLRLRNLSGIVIIDFINMKSAENQKRLLAEMRSLVSGDEIKTKVIDITVLGLMEITRKKVYKTLKEQMRGL